jgi:hypothetical protein
VELLLTILSNVAGLWSFSIFSTILIRGSYLLIVEIWCWRIYANWYADEVRTFMYEDERMRGLGKLAHKELRCHAIQRARMADGVNIQQL